MAARAWARLNGAVASAVLLTGCQAVGERPLVTDSFCHVYQRVIRSEAEGASLASAERPVRERIATNDSLYRCQCQGEEKFCAN